MFKVIDDSTEGTVIKDWPVIINMPQTGGRIAKHQISVDYLMLPQDEIDAMIEASKEADGATDTDIAKRVVMSIGRLVDADDKPMDYTEKLRDMLLKRPYFRRALVQEYFSMASGQKPKTKN